jgi:hypothetical protein
MPQTGQVTFRRASEIAPTGVARHGRRSWKAGPVELLGLLVRRA